MSTIAAKEGAFRPELTSSTHLLVDQLKTVSQNCLPLPVIFERLQYLEAAAAAFPKVSTFSIS